MNFPAKTYPAKLLLFGEYTILEGASALAIPYPAFSGRWTHDSPSPDPTLGQLADFLASQLALGELTGPVDLPAFRKDIAEGLRFASDIPTGYGLGSSGALTAAVYDAYFQKIDQTPDRLKQLLAQIEAFFHGASSGTDPLICYLQRAILLEGKDRWRTVDIPPEDAAGKAGLFLLDTGISRQTGPLVQRFLEKCAVESYRTRLRKQLAPAVDAAIRAFLEADWLTLTEQFRSISRLQWELFAEMIPEPVSSHWEAGLYGGTEVYKLCGAGGGGFLLGLTADLGQALDRHRQDRCLVAYRYQLEGLDQ